MSILEEWRLRDIEQKADRAVSRLYELDSLRSDVGSLERSVGRLSAECDGLRDELARQEDRLRNLEALVEQLSQPVL